MKDSVHRLRREVLQTAAKVLGGGEGLDTMGLPFPVESRLLTEKQGHFMAPTGQEASQLRPQPACREVRQTPNVIQRL